LRSYYEEADRRPCTLELTTKRESSTKYETTVEKEKTPQIDDDEQEDDETKRKIEQINSLTRKI